MYGGLSRISPLNFPTLAVFLVQILDWRILPNRRPPIRNSEQRRSNERLGMLATTVSIQNYEEDISEH